MTEQVRSAGSPWNDENRFVLTLDDHLTVQSQPRCPRCGGDDLHSQGPSRVRDPMRRDRIRRQERYRCRPCNRYFTMRSFPHKATDDQVIEYALSLMPTMKEITEKVNFRYPMSSVSDATINRWFRQYRWPLDRDHLQTPRLTLVQEVK